jgi:hypothetical protein
MTSCQKKSSIFFKPFFYDFLPLFRLFFSEKKETYPYQKKLRFVLFFYEKKKGREGKKPPIQKHRLPKNLRFFGKLCFFPFFFDFQKTANEASFP